MPEKDKDDVSQVSGAPSSVAAIDENDDHRSVLTGVASASNISAASIGTYDQSIVSGRSVTAFSPMSHSVAGADFPAGQFFGGQSTGFTVISEDGTDAYPETGESVSVSGGPSISASGSAVSAPSITSPTAVSHSAPSTRASQNEPASFAGESRFGDDSVVSGAPVSAKSAPSRTYAGDTTRYEGSEISGISGVPRSAEFSALSRTIHPMEGHSRPPSMAGVETSSVPSFPARSIGARSVGGGGESVVSFGAATSFPAPSVASHHESTTHWEGGASVVSSVKQEPGAGGSTLSAVSGDPGKVPESVVSLRSAGVASGVPSAKGPGSVAASVVPSVPPSVVPSAVPSVATSVALNAEVKQEIGSRVSGVHSVVQSVKNEPVASASSVSAGAISRPPGVASEVGVKHEIATSSILSFDDQLAPTFDGDTDVNDVDDRQAIDDSDALPASQGPRPPLPLPSSQGMINLRGHPVSQPSAALPSSQQRKRKRAEPLIGLSQEELMSQLVRPEQQQQQQHGSSGAMHFNRLPGDDVGFDDGVSEVLHDLEAENLSGRPTRSSIAATPAARKKQSRVAATPRPSGQTQRKEAPAVRMSAKDAEKVQRDILNKKFHEPARADAEAARAKRKERAADLMDQLGQSIQTPTAFALAVPQAPRYPRLVTPAPSLRDMVKYQPTQLELEWNRALLAEVDWIGVQDVDLTNPAAYGRQEIVKLQVSEKDRELLQASVPYDKEPTREVWQGKGKVPIFTVRPAYTEVGLRPNMKKQRREEVEEDLNRMRHVRKVRESEEERRKRYQEGIKGTFQTAEAVDRQWFVHLIHVGAAMGMGLSRDDDRLERLNRDPEEFARFKLLRQQTLSMAAQCSPESLASLDTTIRSVLPAFQTESDLEGLVLPDVKPTLLKGDDYDQRLVLSEWKEAWHRWALLYSREMRDIGLTEGSREKRMADPSRRPIGSILQSISRQRMGEGRNELLHPTQKGVNLVSVKEVWADEPEVTDQRELVVVHFETADPLPVQRLCKMGEDFFELENKEQLARRSRAAEHHYEGAILLRRMNLAGKITAEFLLPTKTRGTDAAVETIREEELVQASWNTPTTAGHREVVEYDRVNSFDGKMIHQRESAFIFRETESGVKVSYPPRRLGLVLAPNADELDDPELARQHLRLRDDSTPIAGRKNVKYIFSWDDDLAEWARQEQEGGHKAAYLRDVAELRKRYRQEHQLEQAAKRRRLEAEAEEHLGDVEMLGEEGAAPVPEVKEEVVEEPDAAMQNGHLAEGGDAAAAPEEPAEDPKTAVTGIQKALEEELLE